MQMDTENSLSRLMFMNTIGMSVLVDVIKASAYYMNGSNGYRLKRYSQSVGSSSLAFIQGTGLEIMLDTYHIEYSADKLRSNLFSLFHKKEYIS